MIDIHWLRDAARYEQHAEQLTRNVLPVLIPDSSRRHRRWADVLAWHTAVGTEPGPPPDPLDGIVVALDRASLPAARVLGAATGRAVHAAAEDDDIRCLVHDPVRSVVFVGMPASLPVRRVHRLAATVDRPWGVITAADLAGLSFVVAKILLARRRPDPAALIDMRLSRTRRTGRNGNWEPFEPLTDDRVARWLLGQNWDQLGLDAHGEGAHVNLGRVVLCGLVDGDELGSDGHPVIGCADDPPRCKRVTAADQLMLPLRDLRVRELLLASCNGFTVAGDMYPSGLSCVLSAADGFAARVLTTDRLTMVDNWLAPALMELSAIASPSRVHEFANDVGLRLTGVRPWILFGDPGDPGELLPAAGPDGTLPAASGRSVIPFRHDGLDGRVLEPAGGRLMLGRRCGVLVLGTAANGAGRLIDRTTEWSRLRARMAELNLRVRRAAAVEHAARRLLAARRAGDGTAALTAIRDARLRLEYIAQTGLRECEDVHRRGVWNPMLARQADVVSLCVAAWDNAAAALLAGHLFEGVEQVFADGWPVRGTEEGGPCPRCAIPLAVTVLGDPLGDGPDRCMMTCPVCGPTGSHRAGGPRVRVDLPSRLVAGQRARVLVTTSDPRPEPLAGLGVLSYDVVDKGRGTSFCRLSAPLGATEHELVIDVPANLRADLHTLRVLWVRGLDAASCRARIPGLAR